VQQVFADGGHPPPGRLDAVEVAGFGYRWFRLDRDPAG